MVYAALVVVFCLFLIYPAAAGAAGAAGGSTGAAGAAGSESAKVGGHKNYVRSIMPLKQTQELRRDPKWSADEYDRAIQAHKGETDKVARYNDLVNSFYEWADGQTFESEEDVQAAANHYYTSIQKPSANAVMANFRPQKTPQEKPPAKMEVVPSSSKAQTYSGGRDD